MNVLACPHCGRQFRALPDLLGTTIRCRGCRRMFQVPVAPAGDEPRAEERGPPLATALPAAAPGVFAGTEVRSCPLCGHTFPMQPRLEGKAIRCRKCRSTFRVLTHAERALPDEGANAAEARPWTPTVRPSRRRPRSAEAIGMAIAVLAGGLLAFPVTQLLCWWGMNWDPFGMAPRLRPELRWLAPPHLVAGEAHRVSDHRNPGARPPS